MNALITFCFFYWVKRCYTTQLSLSWQKADSKVSSILLKFFLALPFFHAHWKQSGSVPGQIHRQRKTAENTEHHSSVLYGSLCLGRSFWGRSGFIGRSLAHQVRGGLEWRRSDPSTKIPQKKKTLRYAQLERIPHKILL